MKDLLKIALFSTGILTTSSALLAQSATPTPTAPDPSATPAAPGTATAPAPQGRSLFFRRAALRHHVIKQLGLSADQLAQLKATRVNMWSTVKSIRADASLTPDQQKAKIRDTIQSGRAQMRSVLTPDQQAKLEEMRRNLRQALDF